jgi:enoyl-CoA hydratase/carnithine racemase
VIIVTGAGRGFCAGADISGGADAFNVNKGAAMFQGPRATRSRGGFVEAIYNCRKPSIAAINGPAVGVGITLCLPMDIRIASSEAKIGFIFARRGLVPEAGSAWFLPRLVGLDQALRWCLSGRIFGAQEAKDGGLVSDVVAPDQLLARAREIALEIAENTAPVSVAMTRQMLWQYSAAAHPFELLQMDGPLSVELGSGPDVREGVAAFLEKRKPSFPGKVSKDIPPGYRPAKR